MEKQFKILKKFVKENNLLFEDFTSVEFRSDYVICKMCSDCISVPFAERCPQLAKGYEFQDQVIKYNNLFINIKF